MKTLVETGEILFPIILFLALTMIVGGIITIITTRIAWKKRWIRTSAAHTNENKALGIILFGIAILLFLGIFWLQNEFLLVRTGVLD